MRIAFNTLSSSGGFMATNVNLDALIRRSDFDIVESYLTIRTAADNANTRP